MMAKTNIHITNVLHFSEQNVQKKISAYQVLMMQGTNIQINKNKQPQ